VDMITISSQYITNTKDQGQLSLLSLCVVNQVLACLDAQHYPPLSFWLMHCRSEHVVCCGN